MNIKKSGKNTEWMVVYVTHNVTEAHIVVGRLKSEGIMAIVDHMAGMQAIGITLGTWGEVRVLVHPAEYEAAVAILDPDEDNLLEAGDDNIIYYEADEDDDDERE